MSLIDIPRFKCYVNKSYLTNGKEIGYLEAYCFAVTCIEARPLLFTVHTVEGAIFSRLPIWAIYHKLPELDQLPKGKLDKWGAISSEGQAIAHQYLKDYWVETRIGQGIYKFTIDYFGGGFSEDPEQHKTSNIIFLDNGQICAMPNNYCIFKDEHFTDDEIKTKYARNSKYFMLE